MKRWNLVPIPRMRSDARIKENLGAAEVELSDEEYNTMTEAPDKIKIQGNRTDEQIAKLGELRTKMYGSSGDHDGK